MINREKAFSLIVGKCRNLSQKMTKFVSRTGFTLLTQEVSMNNKKQKGFSLIELLIVMVILGILMILTFPYVRKAKDAAEDGNAFASMKTMLAAQYNFYSQNARYAALTELNDSQYGSLGINAGTSLRRGQYTFVMSPVTPTPTELREGFTIIATRPGYGTEPPVTLTLTERGHADFIFD